MFDIIDQFEEAIAKFYGSTFAVAVDCCTHAIELSLRYMNVKSASCPERTYISLPFTFEKLGIKWQFEDNKWQDYYYIGNTNIIDAAVLWKENSYIPGTLMCLSFQYKKHLNLIRGGAILTDDSEAYIKLKKMSYDGRTRDKPWAEQDIDSIGYHYYMPPETALLGLEKLPAVIKLTPKQWSYLDYPYLPKMKVFNEQH
jgi:dTDP-4-amino-4,6-dideoxygalactose transaminase